MLSEYSEPATNYSYIALHIPGVIICQTPQDYLKQNTDTNISILGCHELAPLLTFDFGKIIPSGLKMGAEHSSI